MKIARYIASIVLGLIGIAVALCGLYFVYALVAEFLTTGFNEDSLGIFFAFEIFIFLISGLSFASANDLWPKQKAS